MTFFPDNYRLFKVIEEERTTAKIFLYCEKLLLYSGEIVDITPENFDRLQTFLEVLIEINSSANPIKFGIVEVQGFLRGFK